MNMHSGVVVATGYYVNVHLVIVYPIASSPSLSHTYAHSQRVNEKTQVVNEYESGKAIPNQQVIGKLERAVGVKLRGKDMGAPLGPKKK